MPHVNKKPLPRKGNLVQNKKTRPRMNYELIGKTILKTIRSKIRKPIKTNVKLPNVNKNH